MGRVQVSRTIPQHAVRAKLSVRTHAATLESPSEPTVEEEEEAPKKQAPAPKKAPAAPPVAVEETILFQGEYSCRP